MTKTQFISVCLEAVTILRMRSPIDTGNLRYNAIKYEWIDENTFKIYIDEKIAPYVFYTNEPWLSPKWKGKKNPNEYWIEKAVDFIANYVALRLKGELIKK